MQLTFLEQQGKVCRTQGGVVFRQNAEKEISKAFPCAIICPTDIYAIRLLNIAQKFRLLCPLLCLILSSSKKVFPTEKC